jgi:hypothetical protein
VTASITTAQRADHAARADLVDQLAILARQPGGVGGHDFASLLSLVAGESGFKAHAVNHRTGAHGPFQFVKTTWLALLREHGAELGVKPELIAQIVDNAKGRPTIADPGVLKDVLALRDDLSMAARAAAFYLDDNRARLSHALHRAPSDAELRLSFLLGAHGAIKLIHAAAKTPEVDAASVLPHAAAANHRLFYDPAGQARSARSIMTFLEHKFHKDAAKYAAYARAQDPHA